MLKAVLFDLDGTLLDIDLEVFLREYFSVLGPALAEVIGDARAVQSGLAAVMESTTVMCGSHDSVTNREVFERSFFQLTGADLSAADAARRIDTFYREEYPALRGTHGPRPGGTEAVEAVRAAGLRLALATNPIFPKTAILERMRWAGLDSAYFDVVTSYEIMHACKPRARYFEQIASMLGVSPDECLMIGDDAELDLPAAHTGMQTYYVGEGTPAGVSNRGTLYDFVAALPDLLS